ncbi:MAG: AAA family ATPase [Miltoncostaeaceae bacterium]
MGFSDGVGDIDSPDTGGIRRLQRVAREHWMLIVGAVLISMLAALAFAFTSDRTYEAEAVIQVTPVTDEAAFSGLPVIGQFSDPLRDLQTLARQVRTPDVEQAAARILAREGGVSSSGNVTAVPIGESFLLSVSAEASDPDEAARIANAYASATLNVRSANFNSELRGIVDSLEASPQSAAVSERLAVLRPLVGGPDPSLALLAEAEPPASPSSPGPLFIGFVGALVGLFWGSGAALLSDTMLSRLRRDRQLIEGFDLPILARLPICEAPNTGIKALPPDQLDAPAAEAFRTLRQNIEVLSGQGYSRAIVFTSASGGEGKTTSALNAAYTLARSGYDVLLIDADLRRPSVGNTLSMAAPYGIDAVLSGAVALDEAVVSVPGTDGRLSALLGTQAAIHGVESVSKNSIEQLMADARARADFVVFDTAPLGVVADALPVVTAADDVFVAVRIGQTQMSALRSLINTLRYHEVPLRGFVLVGAEPKRSVSDADDIYLDDPRRRRTRTTPHEEELDPLDLPPS